MVVKFISAVVFAACLAFVPTNNLHAAVTPSAKPAATVKKLKFAVFLRHRVNHVLMNLESHGGYHHAVASLGHLFDLAIERAPSHDVAALVDVDYARRLTSQLSRMSDTNRRGQILHLLLKNQELGETLAFLIELHRQPVSSIYSRLYKMHAALGKEILKYPNLTAAICVTLFKPLHRHLNENLVTSPSPNAIFKYYVKYRHQMYFGIKDVPARLLVYVVDDCATIREMKWALARYRGDPIVGRLFFTIKYDYSALQPDAVKRVDRAGYNLPNILKYGGICIDQAYFAAAVGKAIGVPTAIDEGISSVVGHAWVGFLQARANSGWWNFNVGRYSEYQGVIGSVKNPMTRRREPDDFMSISAQLIHTTQSDRWAAIALTDAARRLLFIRKAHLAFDPQPVPANLSAFRRKALMNTSQNELKMLDRATESCRGYADEWRTVALMAHWGMLTLGEKEHWSEKLMRLCGRRYPDFALAVLTPMINSVKDVSQRVRLWNRVFPLFADTRFDLAARIRMMQAAAWEKAKKYNRAGECLLFVINRYTNAGPFVITALEKAAKILARQGHKNRILTLYEQTWLKIKPPPRDMLAFESESSWYQVGEQLKAMLKAQGHRRLARKVANELDSGGVVLRAR